MTRFTVIIPSFNRKKYLLKCLETVFEQSYEPDEVIVVDDGSTDGTICAVKSICRRVQVIQQENMGPGAARNHGASVARGDYLAFLDSDDLWLPWTLATFATMIEQYGNPALLAGKLVDFIDQCELSRIVFHRPIGTLYSDFLSSHTQGHFCSANMICVKRDVFQRIGGFLQDRLNAEDHDLALRLGTQRGFVQILNPTTVCYRRHAGSETTDLAKTLRGLERLVANEKKGRYPGGFKRGLARKSIIATYVRPAIIGVANSGKATHIVPLYLATFLWNLRLGRVGYLVAVPFIVVYSKFFRT